MSLCHVHMLSARAAFLPLPSPPHAASPPKPLESGQGTQVSQRG